MITISDFITVLRQTEVLGELDVKFIYPTLYIAYIAKDFERLSDDVRYEWISRNFSIDVEDLNQLRNTGAVEVLLLTPEERLAEFGFLDDAEQDESWLSWFDPERSEPIESRQEAFDLQNQRTRFLHFYGYKGGQARSTVLVMFAKYLADLGFNILIVDADIEAPSTDTMLEVATEDLNATLMGLCGWGSRIEPIASAYIGSSTSGKVDVLACRPKSSRFDMDFAAFLTNVALNTKVLKQAALNLRYFIENPDVGNARYDLVLIDHRTGIAPSVLPIMEALPGSAIIFVRPDGSSRNIENSRIFDTLLSFDRENPGAFVSFSLDPFESISDVRGNKGAFIERLLETLSDSISRSEDEPIDPSELEDYWVLWHHDRALLSDKLPDAEKLAKFNLESLQQLKDVLAISLDPINHLAEHRERVLTRSGATDEGWFIRTPDVARLFSLDNKLLYIFGRKGTGKTRLVRELYRAKLGEPLLVASDYNEAGLPSLSGAFHTLLKIADGDFEKFWWLLLRLGVEAKNSEQNTLADAVNNLESSQVDLESYATPGSIEKLVRGIEGKRVFLIDGVETAVPAADLRRFVESLFRFIGTIQYNQILAEKLTVRLFLRSDLSTGAVQNVEQQIEGRVVYLRWDKTAILNFALGRIASLEWYREEFSDVCKKIDKLESQIEKGAVFDDDAEALLLEIFPASLERNRLKTTTFFSTYFSDAGSETDEKASFYPRLFDVFLRKVVEFANAEYRGKTLKDKRLISTLVLKAYDVATESFINEVRTELYNLLTLDDADDRNRNMVDRLINSFSDEPTPFVVDIMIDKLAEKIKLPKEKIRESLEDMKAIGMFENRQGYSGSWRTGRVYKAGLKMKYVRSPRASN